MIYNIVDQRLRKNRWRKINAVVESTSMDNNCEDTDQIAMGDDDPAYAVMDAVSLHEAIEWAQRMRAAITLHLYDCEE